MFLLGFLCPTYRNWNVPAILNVTKNFVQKAVKLSRLFFPSNFESSFIVSELTWWEEKKNLLDMASSSSVTDCAFCLSNYTCADPMGHGLAFPILRAADHVSLNTRSSLWALLCPSLAMFLWQDHLILMPAGFLSLRNSEQPVKE